MPADPKPPKRIANPKLLAQLHHRWRSCALAEVDSDNCVSVLSLHHLVKHPRDDIEANLVMLCGSGTTGHHGLIEAHDHLTKVRLWSYLGRYRPDAVKHLAARYPG